MSNLSGIIASCLINSLWQVPLIWGVGWIAGRAVRRLGPRAEHAHWVFIFVVAIVTPVLPGVERILTDWRAASGWMRVSSFTLSVGEHGLSSSGVSTQLSHLALPLSAFYVALIVCLAVRLVLSLCGTLLLLRSTSPVVLTTELQAVWRRCKSSYGLKEVRLRSSERVSGPVTLCFRQPVLLMPAAFFAKCTAEDFLAAFAHELSHIKRRDFQKNLIYEFVSLPLAFHPVVWILKSQIRRSRELVCDSMATETLVDSCQYTRALLRLASMVFASTGRPITHAIGIFDANILEERISMINTKQQTPNRAIKFGVITSAVLLLLAVAAEGATMAVVVEPVSVTQVSDAPVFKIGKDVSAPNLIASTEPLYPESDRKKTGSFNGNCIVALIVDTSGMPQNVHITHSLGKEFDANAIKAVKQYRFSPAVKAGQPVKVALNVEVHFQKF